MLMYQPERIYKLIKFDPEYVDLERDIETMFSKVNTLVDLINFKGKIDKNKMLLERYRDTLTSLVNKYCPQYMTEFKAVNILTLTKGDLLELFNLPNNDLETKLIILDNIIHYSLKDGEFNSYQKIFVALYEGATKKEYKEFSEKVHFSYLQHSIQVYMADKLNSGMDENIFKYAIAELNKTYNTLLDSGVITNIDVLKYKYLSAYESIVCHVIIGVLDINTIYRTIQEVKLPEGIFKSQYGKFDINSIEIYDTNFLICLDARDFKNALYYYDKCMEYFNTSLSEEFFPTFCRAMYVYNKFNILSFISVLRRYLKINKFLDIEDNFTIDLPSIDKKFILADKYLEEGQIIGNVGCTDSFIIKDLGVDTWFENSKHTLLMLKKYADSRKVKEQGS